MEPIEVIARFDEQGSLTPLQFTWKGSIQHVESTGRRWMDEAGQHILVMVGNGRIYKLTYRSGEGRWYIHRAESDRTHA